MTRKQLHQLPPDEAQRYFDLRAADIKARLRLLDLAEAQYDAGERLGAAILIHAEVYLKDRNWYQEYPPTDQFAIRVSGHWEPMP